MPHVEGVSHRYVDAGGLRMHVAEAGAGPTLLLLHGWPQNWYQYRRLIPELAKTHRVIAPDLRGWGWTDAPPGGYEKRQLVSDVLALIDALDLERPIRLIGHDWGSIIGFMLCQERPELVSRYLALGGAHPWPQLDLKFVYALRWLWYQALISAPVLGQRLVENPAFVRFLYRLWSADPRTWSSAELDALIGQFEEPARARATVLVYRIWVTREAQRLLFATRRQAPLPTPILFLQGERDRCLHPALLRGGRRNAPNMTVEILPGVGHFVPEEAPEIVLTRAKQFFSPT
jgi:pimeloyl-ACP methyl ester carboxylesterase